MPKTSYEIKDIYGNTFLCNHDPHSMVLQVGSKRMNMPCIRLQIFDIGNQYKVLVEDVFYNLKCAENDLKHGETGTKSMLICALEMIKFLYENVDIFELQDNSFLWDEESNISLSDVYVLTHGYTWYESFLKLHPAVPVDALSVHDLKHKLNAKMDMPYYEFMNKMFGCNMHDADQLQWIKDIWTSCFGTCAWFDFIKSISDEFKDTNNKVFWTNYMTSIRRTINVASLKSILWEGRLKDIPLRIDSLSRFTNYYPFTQSGGTPTKRHPFQQFVDFSDPLWYDL